MMIFSGGSVISSDRVRGQMCDRPRTARRPFPLGWLALVSAASCGLAFVLSGCEQVVGYTQPSLVRVIDASYAAPAVNVTVEGQRLAANIGQGTITAYGTLPASNYAAIDVTAAAGGTALVSTTSALLAGHQNSILLEDDRASTTGYDVSFLEDQQVPAALGHSAFRFLNQAPDTGAVDIYMVPSGSTLADSVPIMKDLPVGGTTSYISFPSQTVTMVITPTGLTTPSYSSASIPLVGGEVRTVLIVDTKLTSNPPVEVFIASDVD